jgi:hypothetical protein
MVSQFRTASIGTACLFGFVLGCSGGDGTNGDSPGNGAGGAGGGNAGQSGSSATAHIAIAGTWMLSGVNIDTGTAPGTESLRVTIDDAQYAGTYSPSGALQNGSIEEYDNSAAAFVIRITRDDRYPTSVGIYEKCGWSLPASDRMILSAYETKATLAEARASTVVVWGPTDPWIKQ